MGGEVATMPAGLVALGRLHLDATETSDVPLRLVVEAIVMRAGHGPLVMEVDAAGYAVTAGRLIWIVTTNKGWAHLRGTAWSGGDGPPVPFRADLYSALAVGDRGIDRFALRLYGYDDDPNVASPTHKIQGWLEGGSIRLGRAR